jgi:hypothetical protein
MKRHYLGTICVHYLEPLLGRDKASGRKIKSSGYFVKIGFSVEAESEVLSVVRSIVTDGDIDWKDTTIEPTDWESMDEELRDRSEGFGSKSVWFVGPQFLFP